MFVYAWCMIYGGYFLDKTFPNPKVNSPLGLYFIVCTSHLWQSRNIVERANFSKLQQSLNFLFLKAKSFNFFFIATHGWVGGNFHNIFFYFFCIFLFGNTITFCIIELFAIMPSYVLYHMDILCHNLLCLARICTLLMDFAFKWYPTTNVWFWLSHTLEI